VVRVTATKTAKTGGKETYHSKNAIIKQQQEHEIIDWPRATTKAAVVWELEPNQLTHSKNAKRNL